MKDCKLLKFYNILNYNNIQSIRNESYSFFLDLPVF